MDIAEIKTDTMKKMNIIVKRGEEYKIGYLDGLVAAMAAENTKAELNARKTDSEAKPA